MTVTRWFYWNWEKKKDETIFERREITICSFFNAILLFGRNSNIFNFANNLTPKKKYETVSEIDNKKYVARIIK